jgi:Mce-associated membrane protein
VTGRLGPLTAGTGRVLGRLAAATRRALGAPARLVDRRLPPGRSRTVAIGVLGVLAAGLLAAAAVLGWSLADQGRIASARSAGLAAAVELTPQLLTYDYRTLPADTGRAEAATTGDFGSQYRALIEKTVGPNAGELQFVSKAEVRDSSVVSATPGGVVALIFISQVTTSKNLTAPRLDSSGVRVTMSEVDGRWLISKLDRV